MKGKKEIKAKTGKGTENGASEEQAFGTISTRADLKGFLLNIRDKMAEETAAPIYALSAMNHLMTLPEIYGLIDNENKEIARDIWLRLKQAGLQLRNPPLFFTAEPAGDGAV